MPQRFLRPGITNSDAWNAVSFEAQSFYVRILTLVDDWGRYDARVPILHAHCFALRPDVKPQRTAGMRSELQEHGLIRVYVVDGKEYLQVEKWQERTRGTQSKFPDPPPTQESAADRSGPQEKDASLAIATTPSPLHQTPSFKRQPAVAGGDCEEVWSAYPNKVGKPDGLRAIRKAISKHGAAHVLERTRAYAALRGGNLEYVPYPSTWFNQERYNDDPSTWRAGMNGSPQLKRQTGTSLRQEQLDRIPTVTV